jgi:hypothetical protein
VKLGLQISRFRWPGGPPRLAEHLRAIARTAEDVGRHHRRDRSIARAWLHDRHRSVRDVETLKPLEVIGRDVVPQARAL